MHAAVPDGVQKVWLDGTQVYERIDVLYTNTATHSIDQLKFDNFHGGNTSTFQPHHDQYMWCVQSCAQCD
jgi:hypothetical protein